jgi:hypothetical protein
MPSITARVAWIYAPLHPARPRLLRMNIRRWFPQGEKTDTIAVPAVMNRIATLMTGPASRV